MCKTKKSTSAAEPRTTSVRHTSRRGLSAPTTPTTSTSAIAAAAAAGNSSSVATTATSSSAASHSSIRSSVSSSISTSGTHLFSFASLSSAPRRQISPTAFRSAFSDRPVVVLQRTLRRPLPPEDLPSLLSSLCKSHHSSIADLLGAATNPSSPEQLLLVYSYVPGATLSHSLRPPNNPSFTLLPSFLSRALVAADLSDALLYIHHFSGLHLIHNHLSSSSVIISDKPQLRASLTHFAASHLLGHSSASASASEVIVQGHRGYMAPETLASGAVSQKSDVFGFGVVLLELLSGREPLKYHFDGRGVYERVSLIDTARDVLDDDDRRTRLRRWVDGRLKDSFPVQVVERWMRVALLCVSDDPHHRPDMESVAATISKLYIESMQWSDKFAVPADFTASFAPR